jgi:hypothetical protein
LEKEIDLLFEFCCLDDVGVTAPGRPEFMVEEIESAWRLGHLIDPDSTSNIFFQTDSDCMAESYRYWVWLSLGFDQFEELT